MAWYDASIQTLPVGKGFTRREIIACLRKNNPALSENSFQWAIGRMVKTGALTRPGFNLYLRVSEEPQRRYHALYSDDALKLIKLVDAKYPNIQFTVFESSLLNEFLNHLVAQNTIFLQVEKDAALFVFRFLQEDNSREVLYKPSKKDFSLYWEKDCIVVIPLVSEAPLEEDHPHNISLEKLLVDLYCDKLIAVTYSKSEYREILSEALKRYSVSKTKLLRYARRRNKEAELSSLLDTAAEGGSTYASNR